MLAFIYGFLGLAVTQNENCVNVDTHGSTNDDITGCNCTQLCCRLRGLSAYCQNYTFFLNKMCKNGWNLRKIS